MLAIAGDRINHRRAIGEMAVIIDADSNRRFESNHRRCSKEMTGMAEMAGNGINHRRAIGGNGSNRRRWQQSQELAAIIGEEWREMALIINDNSKRRKGKQQQ